MLDYVPLWFLQWVASWPGWLLRAVVDGLFAASMLSALWFSYYCFRRALGHRRVFGRWYNADGYQALIQELYTGVREGRVPDHRTMQLLDRHIYGSDSRLRELTRRDSI